MTGARQTDEKFGLVTMRAASADVSKDAFRLLIVLSAHADTSGIAWPSGARLARELGWINAEGKENRQRVSRAMNRLRKADLVRNAGTKPFGESWTRRYLVSPYPIGASEFYEGDESRDTDNTADSAPLHAGPIHPVEPAKLYETTPPDSSEGDALTDHEQTKDLEQTNNLAPLASRIDAGVIEKPRQRVNDTQDEARAKLEAWLADNPEPANA